MEGIIVHTGKDGNRLEIGCTHQRGVLYATRGEASWVCDDATLHAHAMAGFFRELAALDDPKVKKLMRRWGLYFRPLEVEQEASPVQEPKPNDAGRSGKQ